MTTTGLLLGLLAGPAAATTPRPAPGEVVSRAEGAGGRGSLGQDLYLSGTFYQALDRSLVRSSNEGLENLGGILTSGPATVQIRSDTESPQFVFARGADAAIWWRAVTAIRRDPPAHAWSEWSSIGGRASGAPSASCWGDPELYFDTSIVWVRGTDGALWAGRLGHPWVRLGGRLLSDPAAVQKCSIPQRVYALGTDRAVWEFTNRGGVEPGAWRRIGGASTVAPAAIGNLLFARGTDNALWMKVRSADGAHWSRWRYLGGYLTSPPSASRADDGNLQVLALGASGRNIWQASSADDGATWTWAPHVPSG